MVQPHRLTQTQCTYLARNSTIHSTRVPLHPLDIQCAYQTISTDLTIATHHTSLQYAKQCTHTAIGFRCPQQQHKFACHIAMAVT